VKKIHIRLLETGPPQENEVATLPCEKPLIWCCSPDSRHYSLHITSTCSCQNHHLLLGKTII